MWKTANLLMVFVTAAVAIWQVVYWHGQLPDIVPSHFDLQGNVDDEMPKNSFLGIMMGVHAMFLIAFPLLSFGLGKLPDSTINLPNKEYWLAPARRDATLSQMTSMMLAIGWISSWLVIGIVQLTALVGIGSRKNISPESNWLIGAFLLAIALLIGWTFWQYRLPKDAQLSNQPA